MFVIFQNGETDFTPYKKAISRENFVFSSKKRFVWKIIFYPSITP
jgi:hypothetical protein